MEKPFTDFATATDGMKPRDEKRPVIGLSVNIAEETSRLHEAYINAVADAGGVPLLLPAVADREALAAMLDRIDGLLLTGGTDVDGRYFGEQTHESAEVVPERDTYDFLLLRLACDRGLPVFGICRGMQVINIAFGGTIWQDLPSQYPGEVLTHSVLTEREKPAHDMVVEPGTQLSGIIGDVVGGVNSRHHQAVKDVAPGFVVAARSPDGVVEAIEGYPARRILGVQWHPENMAAEGGDGAMKALFGFFVAEALLFARARALHERKFVVDSHCDTPMLFAGNDIDFGRRGLEGQVDIVKMGEGGVSGVFVAAYIPQGECSPAGHKAAWEMAVSLLDEMKRQVAACGQWCGVAVGSDDALALRAGGRKAVFLAVENGYAIGEDLGKLLQLKDMGVVYMTLCHNGSNALCDSAVGEAVHGGLSALGLEAVAEMNRLGMVIDLSHAGQQTFYDVLEVSAAPVICSHSSARALCDHPRNLTDDQLRAIASKGGVVQVCLYGGFLVSSGVATVMDAVEHIVYIANLVGVGHVGIGSDFDGGGGIVGCNGSNELINITVELLRRGFSESDIEGILGGNLMRVVDAVQGMAAAENIG